MMQKYTNLLNKTLIIRFSSIGDIVLTTLLLRVLRKKFPSDQIDFVTKREFAELVKFNQNLNLTYEFDSAGGVAGLRELKRRIREEKYNLVIDLHNSLRSRYLRLQSGAGETVVLDKRMVARAILVRLKKNLYTSATPVALRYLEPLKPFGIEDDGKGLELNIPDEILFDVSGKMGRLQLARFERVIGLCPSAKHETKRWLAERFVELGVRAAKELDAKIFVFGGEEDRERCNRIAGEIGSAIGSERVTDWTGSLSLLETGATMEFCDCVVTNDSGLMHIAAAMKRPVVAIFGSTVQEFGFFPFGTRSVVLQRPDVLCRPCSHIGLSSCPEGHFRCMKDTSVDDVFHSVRTMLDSR
jgi:lipopolysaccharide heptosyltransferase II